jgi:hypothetical protein
MVSMAMPVSEVHEKIERDLIEKFSDMFRAVDDEPTIHGRAQKAIAYWRSLPRLERSLLCEVMRERTVPPPVKRPTAPNGHAHGKNEGRQVIGASNSERA